MLSAVFLIPLVYTVLMMKLMGLATTDLTEFQMFATLSFIDWKAD